MQITGLNKEYLGRDRPTDVISFPMLDNSFPNVQPQILGDVVISLETAGRQAVLGNRSIYEEVTGLLIHGVLHLLGYDHDISRKDYKKMKVRENEIFCKIMTDRKIQEKIK
jgi:probable rRNA maturation factor